MEERLLSGRYELERELGRGGMGVIYRAHDRVLDRDVAVKLLSGANLSPAARERLLNEARSVARLSHPNIVTVFDAGEADGAPFIVMELIEGESLHDRPPTDPNLIVSIAIQVCAALQHAHSHGIVHRDLKPENVILTPDGTAKLTDFGLARSVASRLTGEGTITGTVFYLAPELALGQPFDGRADLYALGVMLYELTTGRLPFTGDDPLAVISQHLHAPVVPPRALNPHLSPALEAVIVALLAKRPEDRPASAGEARHRLEHLDDEPAPGTLEVPSLLDRIARGRFVGRQRELAEAQNHWRRACEGEGHVLLVSGEPGIGKTRFVRELTTKVQVSGGRMLTGECYADASAPYAPVVQLLRDSFDTLHLDPAELPESTAAGLASIVPELRSRRPGLALDPGVDVQAEQQVFESVVAWCGALTARGPLLLFVDDTHWADSASLALLRHLARRARRLPLLIVLTYREIELDQARPWNQVLLDLNRERLASRIKLGRLSHDETCELLCALFGEDLSADLVDALYRETEGNPFFIEEVVKGLVEEGKLIVSEGRWAAPRIQDIEIPQSVRLALQARIANLSPDAQEALRLAAALGREFDFETLRRASDLSEDALIVALESAQRAQLIEEQHDKDGSVLFSFEHGLVRLTLWEEIGSLRRKRLMRRTAEAMQAVHPDDFERIADHYRAAGDATQARRYYLQAAERALGVYANQDAERSFRFVLDLDAPPDERRRALAGLGDSLAPRAQHKQALEAWREAIELAQAAEDWEQVATLYTRMSRSSWSAGDVPGGLALAREGMAALDGCAETPALAGLVHETARACYFNGLPEEGMALATRALEMARRMRVVPIEAEALTTIGVLLQRESRYDEVKACYDQAIALAEPMALYTTAARAHHNLAGILMGMGRFEEGREHARRGVELTSKIGDLFFQTYELSLVLNTSMLLGDGADVNRTYERLLEIRSQAIPAGGPDLFLTQVRVIVLRYRGRMDEIARILPDYIVEANRSNDPQTIVAANSMASELLIDQRRYGEALAPAQLALSMSTRLGAGIEELCQLAGIQARLGQTEEAHRLLREAEGRTGNPPVEMEILSLDVGRARVAAAERDWDSAFRCYESLAAQVRRLGAVFLLLVNRKETARVYLERGHVGDSEKARVLLTEALELARRCESDGTAEAIRKTLDGLRRAGMS